MTNLINKIRAWRIRPLFLKELRQIKADKKLVVSLILPPTLQLVIFGFALNPEVTNLRLGVVDESRTAASREVVSAFVKSRSFRVAEHFRSSEELGQALSAGRLDAGLIVPSNFAERRQRCETARAQLLLDAVNSNTAGIASGYAARIIAALNERIAGDSPGVSLQTESGAASVRGQFVARIALLFNPGLESAWFIVTGVIGILLVLNGSIIGSAAMVKEKEAGTIEQLLNPICHFATIARGVLLRGAGLETTYPHLLALVGFAVLLVGVSAWRFRKQLG